MKSSRRYFFGRSKEKTWCGKRKILLYDLILSYLVITIIARDPVSTTGWKNLSQSLEGYTGERLKKELESKAYLYHELVLGTRFPVSQQTKLSDLHYGLVHLLDTPHDQLTYSAGTSQLITLNSSVGYYIVITDPTFSVISANPETIPRTLITIPAKGSSFQLYLKVNN